jgi:hypothetical protein
LISELKDKEDLFEAVALLQRCYEEMKYDENGHSFDIVSVFRSLVSCVQNGIVLIVKEERLLGIGCVFLMPSFMDANHMQAIEAVWHADPLLGKRKRAKVMIKLLNGMEKKVKELGLKGIHLTASLDFPDVAKYLKKKGYKLREQHYYKEV